MMNTAVCLKSVEKSKQEFRKLEDMMKNWERAVEDKNLYGGRMALMGIYNWITDLEHESEEEE